MTGITRRRLLSLGAGAAFATTLHPDFVFAQDAQGHSAHGMGGVQPLPVPPLLEPDAAGRVTLQVAKGRHSFAPGKEAASAGVNGAYLGPTVRLKNGEKVTLCVENHLGEETTMHWHGLFAPSAQDGGPHNAIAAGGKWEPEVTVGQPVSLNWYHPHPHGHTARQTHMGIAGLMIVTDGKDAERGLPDRYGVDDIPLVLQDRRVIEGDDVYRPDIMDIIHGFRGDTLIVNGVVAPQAGVPAGFVRLRFLNGANARNFHLRFGDDRPLHVVASDGGFIDRPVAVTRLTISPGERYEVLVDFSQGDAVDLLTAGDDAGGADLPLMRFAVDRSLQGGIASLPERLDGPGAAPDAALSINSRSYVFDERMDENMKLATAEPADMSHAGHTMKGMDMGSMDHGSHAGRTATEAGPVVDIMASGVSMTMTDKPFDMSRIDVEAKFGSWEKWEISAGRMAHPFHIHGASFRILTLNGEAPPAHQAGWKDTVLVDGQAELLIHFNREADRDHPFMFHCHILEHEDAGMMAQFITV